MKQIGDAIATVFLAVVIIAVAAVGIGIACGLVVVGFNWAVGI
jgi:hypothetical protein